MQPSSRYSKKKKEKNRMIANIERDHVDKKKKYLSSQPPKNITYKRNEQ